MSGHDADPERLAQFRVIGRLGAGGMGVVYRAEDSRLNRPVALKVLPHAVSDDEDRRRRFLREARAAASINHPNVATIYDVGEDAGRVFIAMELVEGETLRSRMARGRLTVTEAVRITRAIARGVARAHDKGIVHRDLKPDNVMMDADGEPKILDFGLAKLREAEEAQSHLEIAPTESPTTKEGHVLGTPGYMSPEQVRGKPVDVRTDVFALGVCLFEMLSGARPFEAGSTVDEMMAVVRDPHPHVGERNPDVSPELGAIVDTCLAKAPERRYASARELADALDGTMTSAEGRVPSPIASAPAGGAASMQSVPESAVIETRGRGRIVALLGIAAALVVVGGIAWRSRAPAATHASSDGAASAVATARGVPMTEYPPPMSKSPEALGEYARAMQAFRDASADAAEAHLARAVELDPNLAEAQLSMAMVGSATTEDRRKHLAAAVELRSQLHDRDLAMLDIVQARLARDAIDFEDEAARWKAAADRFPLDAVLVGTAGMFALYAGHSADANALLDRALVLDPKFALVESVRAEGKWRAGELDAAIASANHCLAISPSASRCLQIRAWVEQRRGECDKLADDARSMLALEPGAAAPYEWMASALLAQGAPIESVEESERHATEHVIDPTAKELARLEDPSSMAFVTGDFARAIASFSELDRFEATVTNDVYVGDIVNGEILTLDETGQTERALAVADAYAKRLPALTSHDESYALRVALMIRRRAGRLSDAEFRAAREMCTKNERANNLPTHANHAWFPCFAQPASTPADALEALDALARFSPLPSYDGLVFEERVMGRVLFLAGRIDEAIPHLRSAVAACADIVHIPSHVHAAELLGEALEEKGDTAGACAAYGAVLARWGNAKPRSVTADAARMHSKQVGCGR